MKYARVTVQAPPAAASAVHRAAMERGELGDAYLLFGGIEDREPTQFYAVEGAEAPLVDALDDHDAVTYYDVAGSDGDYVYVYTQEVATDANRRLRATFTRDSLVTTLPVVYRADGTASFTVVGARGDLSAALEDARDVASFDVDRVGDYDPRESGYATALTDRQREVVETAVAVGYYDVPRTAGQDDVAAELDCAASTVAEHLRKAEAALAREAVRDRARF
ncbi:MAG: helix-turn-helix domain-containing protein [Halobacterium sp.]